MTKKVLINKEKYNISLISPCFNEEENINKFIERILALKLINELVLIDDGSTDNTVNKIIEIQKKHSIKKSLTIISLIQLTRNFGKESAMLAGLDYIKDRFDAAIFIDADLQHPPEIIPKMISAWEHGAEIVTAVREDREADTFIKGASASIFYKVFNWLANSIQLKANAGDYRLLNHQAINVLRSMREYYRFSKGLIPWTGFSSVEVSYHHGYRYKGSSSWNTIKLLKYGIDSVFSFSDLPLKIWCFIGLIISSISILYSFVVLIRTIFFGIDVPGYASLIVAVLFLGGVQLIGIGVIGDYIGRIFLNSKTRPHYIIRKLIRTDKQ